MKHNGDVKISKKPKNRRSKRLKSAIRYPQMAGMRNL